MKNLLIDLGIGFGISIGILLLKPIKDILDTNTDTNIRSVSSEKKPYYQINYRVLPTECDTEIKNIPKLKRWANALRKEGIYTVSDLIDRADDFYEYSVKEIYSYDGIGKVGITKIKRFLQSYTGNYYRCPIKKPA